MQLCNDQRGVCKGTPVAVTGLPHPELSTKHAIEKRRRRQLAIRWTVSRCAPIRRRFIGDMVGRSGRFHINQLSDRPMVLLWRQTRVEFRGVSALFRDSAYFAKIL